METLNTKINLPYNHIPNITGIKALYAYQGFVEFKTLVDEMYTRNEQRRRQRDDPRRGWTFEFEKDPYTARELDAFFCRHYGKEKSFYWKWDKYTEDGEDAGGNDVIYIVRFDIDRLDFTAFLGYKTFTVPIVTLESE
jgi:hypothetical protein